MVDISAKKTTSLNPTDILFQTPYWAKVKSRLGLEPHAFDIFSTGSWGDVLVLLKNCGNHTIALVPQGPECAPREDERGLFLESLSEALAEDLGPNVALIRYDLPWRSQYAGEMKEQGWSEFPEPRIREMRMNMGTRHWNIKKAFEDMTVASSLVVDLAGSEHDILERMKPKTRYNIRLAIRKGVAVHEASMDNLSDFHDLYQQTARRNGFGSCDIDQFKAMFRCRFSAPGHSDLLFLIAKHNEDILAGAIIGIAGQTATYLYGASADIKRNYMAPSLMHWTAMRFARRKGCLTYEMGAVSPTPNPAHPFHGLYRFKTGFGGRIELRSGSWDYPLDQDAYREICRVENLYREKGEH
ncbi:peptidoglycan bridge formation protein FemAB [Oceanidesulfovibrio indonesiensis]|uniref:Peptidoglycan bridge formation protein FemAB n=1 Tax=Oceanidesulfovibrio indonesiensis TaxID=54767 RepID=A0A7M3MGQ8_9BACT|nr:peptidoglycan bridge formation glycyltransferase FemA/FemB family protein [Oceanidesulfovibrio indonesiensis]TVM18260.1 peptidoglycan bridge formation protein FemAB [Oceanidesulfovibrio indonesiensis]